MVNVTIKEALVVYVAVKRSPVLTEPLWDLFRLTPQGWQLAAAQGIPWDSVPDGAEAMRRAHEGKLYWAVLAFGHVDHPAPDAQLYSAWAPPAVVLSGYLLTARQSWNLRPREGQSAPVVLAAPTEPSAWDRRSAQGPVGGPQVAPSVDWSNVFVYYDHEVFRFNAMGTHLHHSELYDRSSLPAVIANPMFSLESGHLLVAVTKTASSVHFRSVANPGLESRYSGIGGRLRPFFLSTPEPATPEDQKIVVFFGVPNVRAAQTDYFCSDPSVSPWHLTGVCRQNAMEHLAEPARRCSATEYIIVTCSALGDPRSVVYSAGYSHAAYAVLETEHQRWTARPRSGPPYHAPELPPPPATATEEDAKPVLCGFCSLPAQNPQGVPHCGVNGPHVGAAILHDRRLLTGGLVDCPETRAESLRFAEARSAETRLAYARTIEFRTTRDFAQGARPSLACRPPERAPEEIPLVGETPHYEWP